ncbi:MAG: menaquinone biosynthetic enzyme MqnA/MqnD family protein [Deferribacterales bacterium]|jgi:chorismate dehydratase
MLSIGQIDYANVYPIFFQLQKLDKYKLIKGVPSFLNSAIREGGIDAGFCSCIEYARNPEKYYVIPNIAISCNNVVKSVMFFSNKPIEEMEGEEVYLTGESGTSIVLFEILMREKYGITPMFTRDNPDAESCVLIGDKALFNYYNGKWAYVYDLCTLWNEFTGLPFVFALWIVRKDTVHERHDEVAEFARTLEAIKVDSKKNLAALLDHYTFKGLTNYQIIDYWETIKYDLSEAHIKGLLKYYSYAAKLGRVKKVPPLDFFVG